MLSEIQNQDYVQLQSSQMVQSLICALNWRYPHKEFPANYMSICLEKLSKNQKFKFKPLKVLTALIFKISTIDIW